MRYPDDIGYVWKTIAQVRDLAARELVTQYDCYIAYPQISNHPSYVPFYLTPIALDCYDATPVGIKQLERILGERRVLAVVYMSALPSTLNMSLFRRMKVITVNTENDSFDVSRRNSWPAWLTKFIVRRVFKRQLHDLHLANAASQLQFLQDYALIPPNRIALVRNGVDCDHFTPGDRTQACQLLGLDPHAFWVVSVSQARSEKRMDLIIQSAADILKKFPEKNIKFIYIGDGPSLNDWKQLAHDLHLGASFHFVGGKKDVLPYYRAASLMLHAAERESFGLAIVEAMACGLAVVAVAAAGPSETVLHDQTGTLVEINNQTQLTQALERYVVSPGLCALQGHHGMMRARELFSIRRQGREIGSYIKSLLESSQ